MADEPDITVFRPDRPGVRKVLGDLEAEIMEYFWARPLSGGITVRDVFEVLYERRRIAYTTVMNTMTRLAKKKLLRAEKVDRAFVYFPNFTQEEFVSRFVGRILEDLLVSFGGETRGGLAVSAGPQSLARARAWLDEIERRRAGGEGA